MESVQRPDSDRVPFNVLTKPYLVNARARRIVETFWHTGRSGEDCVAFLRESGIFPAEEKRALYEARLANWAERRKKTADQFKAECRAALLKVIAKFEPKALTDECRALIEATKKQVLGA